MDEAYERLAAAIVVQAVKDYKGALRKEARGKATDSTQGTIISCEHFFKSDWFQMLSDLDGVALMEKVRKIALIGLEDEEEGDDEDD